MEFTTTGLEGQASSSSPFMSQVDTEDATRILYGSGLFKEDEWRRSSKLVKTSDDLGHQLNAMTQKSWDTSDNSSRSLFYPHNQIQMLCFSSPKSVDSTLPLRNCPLPSSPYSSCSPGISFGSLSVSNHHHHHHHHSLVEGVCSKTSFTPSQWMELEHQALIYKYINANIPVPFHLLLPIKKAFESAGFSCYPDGTLRSNSLGWGSFHLGFSNSRDAEPGRCRRTDGKKWRCSRDAVAEHKYCERHINRGRHRSRKTVEGHEADTSATVASSPPPSSSSLLSFGKLGTLKELTGGGRTQLSISTPMSSSSLGGPLGEALHRSSC